MAKTTIGVGLALIALGLIGYFATGMVSMTALIPAFFGAGLLLVGLLARRESRRKHAMHFAVALGTVGFFGALPGLFKLPALLAGEAERPAAVVSQSLMALLLLLFVVLCVKSFIDARRARTAAG